MSDNKMGTGAVMAVMVVMAAVFAVAAIWVLGVFDHEDTTTNPVFTVRVVNQETGGPIACAQLTAIKTNGEHRFFGANEEGVINANLETGDYLVRFSCSDGSVYLVGTDGDELTVLSESVEYRPGEAPLPGDFYEEVDGEVQIKLLVLPPPPELPLPPKDPPEQHESCCPDDPDQTGPEATTPIHQ